jgi:hypothetical protein
MNNKRKRKKKKKERVLYEMSDKKPRLILLKIHGTPRIYR